MAAIVAVASITLFFSFICSLFEAALYSITPTQVELLKRKNAMGAHKLAILRAQIDKPIAAILTINTIAHTLGSAWCGALVGEYYSQTAVGVFAGIFTFLILFLTEIVPKSLGVNYAHIVGPWSAWPLQVMIWVAWPVAGICGLIMAMLTRGKGANAPTEDEIVIMTRLALQGGTLRAQELRWVENALRLDKIKAYDLMTPRTVVYSLPADLPLSAVQERSDHWIHSRLPLTEDRDPDRIMGMVYRREVFDAVVRGKTDLKLRDLMHEIDFVPDTMRGHQLLDKFIQEKKHMVAVLDEYGGFEGVVTLEDVLECMLGSQIVDEHDRHADMQHLARQRARRSEKAAEGTSPSDSSENPAIDAPEPIK